MSWPDYDSSWNPYFGDGETHGRELGRISPEGNIYGQTRFVREWLHHVWWDGKDWLDYVVAGQLNNTTELPSGRHPFGEIYEVKRYNPIDKAYYWDAYYYNSEYPDNPWKKMKMLWDVDAFSDLPIPGIQVGVVQRVVEKDVLIVWTGFQWERLKHSTLKNDEEERHLPPGFLNFLIPDVEVVYVNQYELSLEPVAGGSGAVFVNGDLIQASPDCAVFCDTPALNLTGGALVTATLVVDTEYWIYLASTLNSAFNTDSYDYRGKLFLSTTTPVDGYLGTGHGKDARLAGRIQTNADGNFARELDISLISRNPSIMEAFREYSDFVIEFVDQDTLKLTQLDGTYGQIFVPDSLHYVGVDYTITRTDDWIQWDDEIEGYVTLMSSALQANAHYNIYIAGMVDAFNFNAINPLTGRPWQESDDGAEDNYVSEVDLRIKPFLSPKAPDHGRMAEVWPGFYTRWIGQVRTDTNGKFKNARDLSMIRQPTLNPTYFDGLAEITFAHYGETEFRVAAIRGTSGIVNVAGAAIQAYDKDEVSLVHRARTTDTVQDYDEEDLETPLSNLNTVSSYTDTTLYLYMANNRSHWGSYANKIFWSLDAPTGGYLSSNWPGNQARWIATVYVNDDGEFGSGYLEDAVVPMSLRIDDSTSSPQQVWSSAKISAELTNLWTQISVGQAYNNQKTNGCPLRLEYVDSATIKIIPTIESPTIAFPDLTTLEVGSSGVSLSLTGLGVSHGTIYYVWLSDAGLAVGTTAPVNVYDNLQDDNNDSILVGYLSPSATNAIAGVWNVYSFWNEPNREWAEDITDYIVSDFVIDDVELDLPGFFVPSSSSGAVVRTGSTTLRVYGWHFGLYYMYCETIPVAIGEEQCQMEGRPVGGTLTVSSSVSTILASTVYDDFTLDHEKSHYDYDPNVTNVNSKYKNVTGSYKVTRQGS